MIIKFYKLHTKDEIINRIQDNLITTLNPIFNNPTIDGVVLSQVTLQTGTNIINHKLGRNLIGWELTRKRAIADIYDDQDNNLTPAQTLVLISSANIIVDIYVF